MTSFRISELSPEMRKKRKEWEKEQEKKYGKDWRKKSLEKWDERLKK